MLARLENEACGFVVNAASADDTRQQILPVILQDFVQHSRQKLALLCAVSLGKYRIAKLEPKNRLTLNPRLLI